MATTMSKTDQAVAVAGADQTKARQRPVLLGIVGDSAAGKTTLTEGIVNIFGPDRVLGFSTDDYHKYDRKQRKELDITPLHPDCNYIDIMEQHLRLLSVGEPILKPVYGHSEGTLEAPELVEPKEIVIIEGLLGYHTKTMRDTYDVKVYLDPPEDLRRKWKIDRDTSKRGYTEEDVHKDLDKREPDLEKFIRPQREYADIVVRFHPPGPSLDIAVAKLAVRLFLRPTLPHPYLMEVADRTRVDHYQPFRLSLARDHGKPVDVLEVAGDVPQEQSATVEKIIWEDMGLEDHDLDRDHIGLFQHKGETRRSESLALTQLLLLAQLVRAKNQQ